jgi:hypothetical protein
VTYSIQVANGDLVATAGQLSTVSDSAKLLQDLTLWILTKMGSDPYNPAYGSLIDGGTQMNGINVPSPIGTTTWSIAQSQIQTDITRIITLYQAQQAARIASDLQTYNKSTLTPGETLTALNGISFNNDYDTLTVTVSITNAANQNVTITLPFSGTVYN